MTDLLSAILLGFVQGLTEFLPVSSSAHLVLFQKIFGRPENDILFDVLLHTATMAAVLLFLWPEILRALRNPRIVLNVIIGTVVTAAIVMPFKDLIEKTFEDTASVGVFLALTGVVLFAAERFYSKSGGRGGYESLGPWRAVAIGVAQGIAVLPGISRSGSTISAGMMLGIEKTRAARYSFILSVPAVLGATLVKLKDTGFKVSEISPVLIAGMVAAFISGILALYVMTRLIDRIKFHWFSLYCFLLGGLIYFMYR
jgi:undecaprenyl-diphosphatase